MTFYDMGGVPHDDSNDDDESSSIIGRTFGDFTVTEKLGEGGGGEIYRAEQITLGREAVIKVMSDYALYDPAAADRFLREARLASRLDHPFMAHVYGFGSEADGTLWIAMELVRGLSLEDLVRQQGPMPLPRFIPFLERLCEVLFAAHEQGIVHRDIKPHNVMVVNRSGRLLPKLLDLGIARRESEPVDKVGPEAGDVENEARRRRQDAGTWSERLAKSETMDITMQGSIVGTPQYMAPEQWQNSSNVDARSDLYSLALLAYYVLTGRNAFGQRGGDVMQLLRAHAKDPLPPLPKELPLALYEVLSKGAAKRSDDRYSTALEFAEAMRAASGLRSDAAQVLPQLDKGLLDAIVSDAPQPIAEAVALIEGARSLRQQLEAIALTRKVCIRYLAMLALAARGRVGPGAPSDAPAVLELLGQLAVEQLSDRQWLTLAQELARPFAAAPAAHPVPELVQLFCGEADPQAIADGAGAWWVVLNTPVPDADAPAEEQLAAATRLASELSIALQKTSFVFDYSLTVRHEESERWMGTRRLRRLPQAMNDAAPPTGVPFLVDRDGVSVLTLAPLMQVFAPSGGMPEELFFLEGVGRHGARLAALPGPFERQSDEVWAWFSRHVLDVSVAQRAGAHAERPPYKGLSTFSSDDADNYYGREKEAEEFANRLKASHLLVVVGPSGAGKSSFVLAGVLPLLPAGCRALVLRPGANPLTTLQIRLASFGVTQPGEAPEQVAAALASALGADEAMLLVVDQFEELVTLCADAAQRSRFAKVLIAIADHPSGRLRVVFTLRDDFLIKVQQIDALRDRLSNSLQLIATPAQEDLLRVVTEPARRVGYGFDDADLPRKMVEAVLEYPGALAMLSFTASQLWDLRDRQLRQMRAKTYEALGGVGGALGHHAEATLAAMTQAEQELVREAFRHLVTAQGTRAVLSRAEMTDVLGGGPTAQSVIEKLIVARLLVSSETAEGDDRLEIIHEALIVSWPRLVGWSRQDAETARFRDSLRASARQWDERGRLRGQLWRAEPLAEYKVWRSRFRGRLTQVEEAFARASLRDETAGRRLKQGLATGAFVVLLIALGLILRAYQESKRQYLALREEQARLAVVDDKPLEALAYLDEAVSRGADDDALRDLVGVSDYLTSGEAGVLTQHELGVWKVRLSPDGKVAASFADDGHVGLTSVADDSLHQRVDTGAGCRSGSFTPDGTTLLASCGGALLVIDVASGRVAHKFAFDAQEVLDVVPDRVPGAVIIARRGIGVQRLSLATGATQTLFSAAQADALALTPSPDGKLVVLHGGPADELATSLKAVTLIELEHGTVSTLVVGSLPRSVSFDGKGENLAIGTGAGEVAVWSLTGKRWAWRRTQHTTRIRSVAYSSRGTLVSAGSDAVRAWDPAGGASWSVSGKGDMANVCWSGDGRRVFAGGGGSILWSIEAEHGDVLWRFPGHRASIMGCVVLPGDRIVLTASLDGGVRRWHAQKATHEVVTALSDVRDVAAQPGGALAAVLAGSGVYLVDRVGAVSSLLRRDIAAEALTAIAMNDAGAVVAMADDHLWRFEVGRETVVGPQQLPGPGVALSLSADASRVAVLMRDEGMTVVDGEGRVVSTLRHADNDFSMGPFVTPRRLLTCSVTGKLRLWDTETGVVLDEQAAHKGLCYVDLERGLARTSSSEKGVNLWRIEHDKLLRVQTLSTSFGVEVLGRGERAHALTWAGAWALLSPTGAVLASLPLRPKGFVHSSAAPDALWFVDREARLAKFVPPLRGVVQNVAGLQKARGIWMIDQVTGALVER